MAQRADRTVNAGCRRNIVSKSRQNEEKSSMKTKPALITVAAALILIIPFANNAVGVEGGLGRPISGATINPYAGLVPPLPGFAVGVTEASLSPVKRYPRWHLEPFGGTASKVSDLFKGESD